jgi:delta-aminolevulinic acid dehydratase/porphobilinogen synthase
MDSANSNEALHEVFLDSEEGADMVMIKPGHALFRYSSTHKKRVWRTDLCLSSEWRICHAKSRCPLMNGLMKNQLF